MGAIEGVWPVLCTPFGRDGAVDAAALRRVVDFALRSGAAGLVYPGFASEVDELSPQERRQLLGVVVEAAAGRAPVLAGASAGSVEEVVARLREAEALGVRQAMIQAPKSVGVDAAAVAAFYRAIAAACPDVEIVLQNAPAPRGSDLTPAAVKAVVAATPAIRYVKEETIPSGGPISAILAEAPGHLAGVIGGGGARFVIDEFLRGACGAMPAVEFTDIHVALWRALADGREREARDLYERTLPLLMIQSHARMRFTKRVLMRRGVLDNDATRARIPAFDARDLAEIDTLLDRIAGLLGTQPLRSAA
ncbi:MAG: dihydrodipicolinate synthase family protein [Methylobacteriaceae bacterium]|nr:dihydrodipicolinate synthase family protein [Methylobacteriaceae bacterium]